jgi:hypothetical protein
MTYAFVHDVPGDAAIYAEIDALLPNEPPPGLLAHVAIEREGSLRYVDVWESEADWARFRDDHVVPAVDEVLAGMGIPHDHSLTRFEEVNVIDVKVGAPTG